MPAAAGHSAVTDRIHFLCADELPHYDHSAYGFLHDLWRSGDIRRHGCRYRVSMEAGQRACCDPGNTYRSANDSPQDDPGHVRLQLDGDQQGWKHTDCGR